MRRTVLRAIECAEYEASSTPGVSVAGNILKDEQLSPEMRGRYADTSQSGAVTCVRSRTDAGHHYDETMQ
jgi:hypothetical protein